MFEVIWTIFSFSFLAIIAAVIAALRAKKGKPTLVIMIIISVLYLMAIYGSFISEDSSVLAIIVSVVLLAYGWFCSAKGSKAK